MAIFEPERERERFSAVQMGYGHWVYRYRWLRKCIALDAFWEEKKKKKHKMRLQLTTNKPWLYLCSKLRFNFPNGLLQHFGCNSLFLFHSVAKDRIPCAKWFKTHLFAANSVMLRIDDSFSFFCSTSLLRIHRNKSNWVHFIKLKLQWNASWAFFFALFSVVLMASVRLFSRSHRLGLLRAVLFPMNYDNDYYSNKWNVLVPYQLQCHDMECSILWPRLDVVCCCALIVSHYRFCRARMIRKLWWF